jgi:murein L,D-transpeptidase YcbB/YkuD
MKARLFALAGALLAATFVTAAAAQQPVPTLRELRLVVNIPAGRLHVYEGGTLTRNYPVSVGTRGHQTPAGQYRVSRVVWNPWWHPPEAAWAAKKKVTPPGPGNPMGRAKIFFKDPDYYIHGTPGSNEARLGRPASHGCIRMRNADVMALARLIHRYDPQGLSDAEANRLAGNPKETREVTLTTRIVTEVIYTVVEVQKGHLKVHPDVYGFASADMHKRINGALAANGVDTKKVNREVLNIFLKTARTQTSQIPLHVLTAPPKKVNVALSLTAPVELAIRALPVQPVAEKVAALDVAATP